MNRRELQRHFETIKANTSFPEGRYRTNRGLEEVKNQIQPANILERLQALPAGSRVLEVGIGKGRAIEELKKQFPHLTFIGTNLFSIRNNPSQVSNVVKAEASKLPFRNNTFDFVYSIHVLQHVPDKVRFLREVHRVLKKRRDALISDTSMGFAVIRREKGDKTSISLIDYLMGGKKEARPLPQNQRIILITKTTPSLDLPLKFNLSQSRVMADGRFVSIYNETARKRRKK